MPGRVVAAPMTFLPIEDFADDPDCPPFILDAVKASGQVPDKLV